MFKLQLVRWFQGLLKGCVQGGAIAAKAFLGTNIIAPAIHRPDLEISLQGGLLVFASGALYHLWDYLASNPLPDVPAPDAALSTENAQLREALAHYKNNPPPHPSAPITPIPPISPPAPS